MRYQELGWSCGPAALRNAASALGLRVSERHVRSLAGTTEEDGTNEVQLSTAARALGMTVTTHTSADRNAAWAFVRSSVLDGRPCLLCTDQWSHWVAVVGIVGDRVLVVDSAKTKTNQAENGVQVKSKRDLVKRWCCRHEDEPFYAISVGK